MLSVISPPVTIPPHAAASDLPHFLPLPYKTLQVVPFHLTNPSGACRPFLLQQKAFSYRAIH